MTEVRTPRLLGLKMTSNRLLMLGMAALLGAAYVQDGAKPRGDAGETITVPFQMLPSNHMVVEAKVNGKGPYRFIFDLGAPVTLLTNKVAEEAGAIPKGAPRSPFMGTRGPGEVKSLAFGDLVAEDVPVIIMDHPVLGALGGLFQRPLSGIIGYTFWARYRMTIDYQARRLTFTPVDFEVKDLMKEMTDRMQMGRRRPALNIVLAPRGLWGLDVGPPEDGITSRGVPITRVVPGSPAEIAGLKVGDVLVSLDGRWTTTVADTYAAAEKVEPGRAAEVVVLRDGRETALTVTPREGL
jgi:hypothetical protein